MVARLKAFDCFRPEMHAAVSVLPGKNAEQADTATLEHLERRLQPRPLNDDCRLHWADFDRHGRLVGFGSGSLSGLTAGHINQPREDPQINVIASYVKNEGAQAGDIFLMPAENRFLWFVPVTDCTAREPARTNLRGVSVSKEICDEVLEVFNHRANLTPSEKLIIFQLVAGLSKRQSALRDDVSVETKRAHTKNACAKMECAGQAELIKKVLGQFVYLVNLGDTETA